MPRRPKPEPEPEPIHPHPEVDARLRGLAENVVELQARIRRLIARSRRASALMARLTEHGRVGIVVGFEPLEPLRAPRGPLSRTMTGADRAWLVGQGIAPPKARKARKRR